MMRQLHIALWLAVLTVLPGCSPFGSRQELPAQHVYMLRGAEAISAVQDKPGCHVLLVNSPRAAPGFATSAFAYHWSDARIQYFAYHRWTDSPARMFQSLLVDAAEKSKLFEGVVTPGAPVQGDVRLDSEILELSQRFNDDGSDVRFAVRVRLYGHGRLLGSDVMEAIESAESNPQSGVEAVNRASARVLEQIIRFTQTNLEKSRLACPPSELEER